MAEGNEEQQRQRKIATSGALARVLEEVQGKGGGIALEVQEAAEFPKPDPLGRPRFFPTKGYARVAASACRPWRLADRPATEFEHIEDLAASLQTDGQYQPVVVRPATDRKAPEIHYEVIAGQVRWRAAMKAGVDLDISIRDMDDATAFRVMVGENEFRKGLSDYAKAQRLAQALKEGVYGNRTALASACRLSPSQLSYFLGFAELDAEIIGKFKDVRNVSARLGYALNAVVKQGFTARVLRDLALIESGEIRRESMPAVWRNESNEISPGTGIPSNDTRPVKTSSPLRFVDKRGVLLFSVKAGTASTSLRFGKQLQNVLDESLWKEIQVLIERRASGRLGS